MKDYRLHRNHFAKITGVSYLSEINADNIYAWLDSMAVSKLTRLKCLKAILMKCFDNGWVGE